MSIFAPKKKETPIILHILMMYVSFVRKTQFYLHIDVLGRKY